MSDIVQIKSRIIEKIFPKVPGIDLSKLKITHTGLYSVSKVSGSNKLVDLIKKHFHTTNVIITDATANVGSDTINMALHFKSINSIEISKDQFDVLKNNVDTYKLTNVNLYNDNSLNIIPTIKQDIIYIDAPWGGSDYRNDRYSQLFLCEKELSVIYEEYKTNADLIIFKVPKNYDFGNFIQKTNINEYHIYPFLNEMNSIKFYFIFCSK